MSRAQRRTSISRFRREAQHEGLVSYLIDASASLDGHEVLRDALNFWRASRISRRPCCIGCRADLADPLATPGAYLFAIAAGSPGVASVSAFCRACWHDLPDAEIEAVALRVLGRLLRGARFEDAR